MDTVLLAGSVSDYLRHTLGSFLWTLIVFIFYVLIAWFIVYPLVRYLFCRFKTWFFCRFGINNQKNCRDAWLLVERGFLSFTIPSWRVRKPDFVLYSKDVTYIVKLHSFYSRRKQILFISPERWCFRRRKKDRKTEKLLTVQSLDSDFKKIKTKPAPLYMVRYAQELAREINAPVVPVMLHSPTVKFLNTRNGVIMNNGEYTFYGMIVADNDSLKKTVLPQEDREIPLLNGAERKVIAGKIKKIMNQDLR